MLLLFVASCYSIYNARKDAAAKKEFDIVIQMTLEHVLVQRFKKKEMNKKKNFQHKHVNVTKQANSPRIMI